MSCEWTPEQCDILPSIVHGDSTPEGIRLTIDGDHGMLQSVELIVKTSADAASSTLELTSGTGEITLTATTEGAWDFLILPFEATPVAGEYVFALRTTNTDEANRTWIEGNWTIKPKI